MEPTFICPSQHSGSSIHSGSTSHNMMALLYAILLHFVALLLASCIFISLGLILVFTTYVHVFTETGRRRCYPILRIGSVFLLCLVSVSPAMLGFYCSVPFLTQSLLWIYTVTCKGTMSQQLCVSIVGLTLLLCRHLVHKIGSAGMNGASIGVGLMLLIIGNPLGLVTVVLLVYYGIIMLGLLACIAHLSLPLFPICHSLLKWVTGTTRFRRRGLVILFRMVIPTVMDVLNHVLVYTSTHLFCTIQLYL